MEDTSHNENIPLTICRPSPCNVNISPISSPLVSPRHTIDAFYNAVHNHQGILKHTSTPNQQKELIMILYYPLRHQQGIWPMQPIQTYCLLYHDVVRNVTPVDNETQHNISYTLLSTSPISKRDIQSVQPYTTRKIRTIQKLCTIIYTYRCSHQKTIQFTILSSDSLSTSQTTISMYPYKVIKKHFTFTVPPYIQ